MTTSINLYASADCWLWREEADGNRMFVRGVTLPSESLVADWHECDNNEKTAFEEQWALDHPVELPEEVTENGVNGVEVVENTAQE